MSVTGWVGPELLQHLGWGHAPCPRLHHGWSLLAQNEGKGSGGSRQGTEAPRVGQWKMREKRLQQGDGGMQSQQGGSSQQLQP